MDRFGKHLLKLGGNNALTVLLVYGFMGRFGKHLLELGGNNALITCLWTGSVSTCWSWVATTLSLLVYGHVR
jgi:hypothetical protein